MEYEVNPVVMVVVVAVVVRIPLSVGEMKGVASGNLMDLTLIGSNSSALKSGSHQIRKDAWYYSRI